MLLHSMYDYSMLDILASIPIWFYYIPFLLFCNLASLHLTFVLRPCRIFIVQCVMPFFVLPLFILRPAIILTSSCNHCLTSWRQALLGRKFQLHASLAACAWVWRLRGDRDYIRIKTFTRPDECILNAKMIWIEMWRTRACGQEVVAFDGWNNFREANLSRHK